MSKGRAAVKVRQCVPVVAVLCEPQGNFALEPLVVPIKAHFASVVAKYAFHDANRSSLEPNAEFTFRG